MRFLCHYAMLYLFLFWDEYPQVGNKKQQLLFVEHVPLMAAVAWCFIYIYFLDESPLDGNKTDQLLFVENAVSALRAQAPTIVKCIYIIIVNTP